jgi:hypothetical protein
MFSSDIDDSIMEVEKLKSHFEVSNIKEESLNET